MAVGSHAWFVRDGTAFTVPSSGTTARESKPGAPDTVWSTRKFGIIEDLEFDPGRTAPIEVMGPAPGKLVREDVVDVGEAPKVTFNVAQMDALAFELAFRTLALDGSSTQYNPGEKAGPVKGWLKVEQYDSTNVLRNTMDIYGELSLAQPLKFNPKEITKPSFQFLPLRSTLNTGTL